MNMMRSTCILALFTLAIPGSTFAASKEQQEMQRDIAQLQDQVRLLQSGFDQKMATLQTLVEQALDAGNKANTNVSVLSANVTQTLTRELNDSLRPIAGLSTRVDNLSNDSSEIKNSLSDLNTQMNRLQQQLTDINNAVKVIQAPAAAPPPSNTNSDATTPGFGTGPATVAPSAQVLYSNATNDSASGKSDLAAQDWAEFLRYYPDDPFASEAQFQLGQIHLSQMKYTQAVMDFDTVLDRYPESKVTPNAYFMKGMALQGLGKTDAAIAQWKLVVRKYPKSEGGKQAAQQLRAFGVSAAAPGAAPPPRKKQ
jgi:TolA-binding protein